MQTVVVAHGLWMPGIETALLRRRLKAAGFDVRLFRFPTVKNSIDENVARLAAFCAAIPGDRLDFVAYSLGGIVALSMLRTSDVLRAGRVVCMGSPLNGSRAAARLARSSLGRRLVGRSMLQLIEHEGLDPWRGATEVGVIAGGRAFGLGRLFSRLPALNDGTVAVD